MSRAGRNHPPRSEKFLNNEARLADNMHSVVGLIQKRMTLAAASGNRHITGGRPAAMLEKIGLHIKL